MNRRVARQPLVAVLLAAWLLSLVIAFPLSGRAFAADPDPSASPGIIAGGDPRSNGQGPGLVGSPVVIALGVLALGVAAAAGTLLYLRMSREG